MASRGQCIDIDRLAAPAVGKRVHSLRSGNSALSDVMDLRLILVAAPILLAASWAVFHIGRAAVGQLQLFIKRAA